MTPPDRVRSYPPSHRLPSASEVMAPSNTPFGPEGTAIELTAPVVVMRPSWPAVNHSAPSGPAVIAFGAPRLAENDVSAPLVVERQIRRSKLSVNHTAPSGPARCSWDWVSPTSTRRRESGTR